MKIAIYSPYLDTFGGGERYVLTVAEVLSQDSQVDLLLDTHLADLINQDYITKANERFRLDLAKVNLVKAPIGKTSNFFTRLKFLKQYDVLFYLTDGSVFLSTAKRNFVHIQSPFEGQPAKNLWGRIKLFGWERVIYNSEFTRKNASKFWPIKDGVIYPPVDTTSIKPLKKKKYVLSVGRFFGYLKEKKHEVMIQVFSDMYKSGKVDGWSLNLAGSATQADLTYVESLKKTAAGLPVSFHLNLNYQDLIELYGESSIYWHAMGYQESDPTKMEHFGISTVEAMAAGCVPVVINKGGQTEIVTDGENGFLWESLEDLKSKTQKLIVDEKLLKSLSENSLKKAQDFSKENFEQDIKKVFYG
ncbi:glycosyltransferase [Candidatus Daviesbacteria bacterium]|nr:glycosyltransferase [Candidatus Daviesbacteria bacterium]